MSSIVSLQIAKLKYIYKYKIFIITKNIMKTLFLITCVISCPK